MRRMTGPSAGADYEVLRTYYIHAVRSLIDYSAIALAGLSPGQLQDLEIQQNMARQLIVGAPLWTKISNLQMEANITPVEVRVTKNVAALAAKLLTRPGYAITGARLLTAIAQGEQFENARWTRRVSNFLMTSGSSYVATLKEVTPCENYKEPPPWIANQAIFSCKLPKALKGNVVERRMHGELHIARLTNEDAATYFTDWSVDLEKWSCLHTQRREAPRKSLRRI